MDMHKEKREISNLIKESASKYPVILVSGPRQSGKTTLSKDIFPELDYINFEDLEDRAFALEDPKAFLAKYPQGAILDEIQRVPELTSYIQVRVDQEDFIGTYVLTGSQNFSIMDTLSQSLAGRVAIYELLPFSLQEVSSYLDTTKLEDILYTGFYPRIHHRGPNPTQAYEDYVKTYLERDLRQLELVKDLSLFQKFTRLLAGRSGQLLNIDSLGNETGISASTAKNWLSLLEASYLIFRLPPFFENIGKRLIKSPKIYFYDVGLLCYLIGIENPKQLETHPLRGNIFENMIVAEVLKQRFNHKKSHNLLFYRDSNNNEVDLLVPNGHLYDLIEIKSSGTIHTDFFKGLKNFAKNVNKQSKMSLVYSGEKERTQSQVEVVPYYKFKI